MKQMKNSNENSYITLFKELRKDIEKEVGIKDLTRKIQKQKYVFARGLFVHVLQNKSIPFRYDLIADFLKVDRTNIYNYFSSFESLVNSNYTFDLVAEKIYEKWLKDDWKFLNIRVKKLFAEAKKLNEKIDKLVK